nr:hypothetical protein [uncultured Pedobacter sp.]
MGLFKHSKKWENFNGNINIYEDLETSDIEELLKEEHLHSLQFYMFKNPSRKTWEVLEQFYRRNPQFGLHIFWYEAVNFCFLDYIPSVRNLSVTSYLTADFIPLLKLPDLKRLSIGETKSTSVDVSFVSEFRSLESLYIDGMKKGLDCISKLSALKVLTLRGVKLANLNMIFGLENLRELNLLYGSYKNLEAISSAKNLQILEISRTRQIPNFSFLDSLGNLISLTFEGMSKMEVLPDLKGLINLKKIQIDNNSSLTDISAVEQLKKLEQLVIFFPENFKAEFRRTILSQMTRVLLNSTTIKFSTLINFMEEPTQIALKIKGIENWNYSIAKLETPNDI